MPLGIFHQHGRRIKSHWLIVEDGAGECSKVLHFEVRRGIGDQGEAGGMRLGKTVQCKRADVLHDAVLRLGVDAVRCHPGAEIDF